MVRPEDAAAPIPLTWPRVHAFRLAHHHLLMRAPPGHAAEVVGATCGIQAQLMSAAQLALRARVRRLTPDDIERALWKDRTLVKTWFVRGSVHLIPSADLGIFLGALQPREARMLSWLHSQGLPPREAQAIVDAILAQLRGGPLTRQELADRVGKRLGAKARGWVASSWGGVVRLACARGLVCFGPEEQNETVFVRVEDWLPHWEGPAGPEASFRLLRRYLGAYGPATTSDYGLWTNLLAGDVRRAWLGLQADLVEVETDGRVGFALRADVGKLLRGRLTRPVVRLLPNFDVFLLGHRDKGHLVDSSHYKRVYRKAGWIYPSVLVNGRIEGTWSLGREGRRVLAHVAMFTPPSQAVREGVASEAEDIGRFLGTPCDLALA